MILPVGQKEAPLAHVGAAGVWTVAAQHQRRYCASIVRVFDDLRNQAREEEPPALLIIAEGAVVAKRNTEIRQEGARDGWDNEPWVNTPHAGGWSRIDVAPAMARGHQGRADHA